MSLTLINADGTSPVVPSIPGRQKFALVKITFDDSYPTGGEILTPAAVGLLQIDAVIANACTTVGRLVNPVLASGVWKLKVSLEGVAVFAEQGDTTDLSADSVYVLVVGK